MTVFASSVVNADNIKIRWEERYVSAGLNRKNVALSPAGVYRGYVAGQTSPASKSLELRVDPTFLDSVAAVEDAVDGFTTTVWHSAKVTIDVTGAWPIPGGGRILYVVLIVDYRIGGTNGYIRVVDAAELATLTSYVRICRLDIPDVATTIIDAYITQVGMTAAANSANTTRPWVSDNYYGMMYPDAHRRMPTWNEKNAMDFAVSPSASNPFATENDTTDKVIAEPNMVTVAGLVAVTSFALPAGTFYFGTGAGGTSAQWLKMYEPGTDYELTGSDDGPIYISDLYKNSGLTVQLVPSADCNADGFYVSNGTNLYVKMDFTLTVDLTYTGSIDVYMGITKTLSTLSVNALLKKPIKSDEVDADIQASLERLNGGPWNGPVKHLRWRGTDSANIGELTGDGITTYMRALTNHLEFDVASASYNFAWRRVLPDNALLMAVLGSGLVGIGVNPTEKLEVDAAGIGNWVLDIPTGYGGGGVWPISVKGDYQQSGAVTAHAAAFHGHGDGVGAEHDVYLASKSVGSFTGLPNTYYNFIGTKNGAVTSWINYGGGSYLQSSLYIGALSPTGTERLYLYGTGSGRQLVIDAPLAEKSEIVYSSAGSPQMVLYRPISSTDLRLFSNTLGDMVYFQQATGNVGIGSNNNPTQLLHIEKALTGAAREAIRVKNLDVSSGGINSEVHMSLASGAGATAGYIGKAGNAYTASPGYTDFAYFACDGAGIRLSAFGGSGVVNFFTGGDAAINERMRIASTGEVGIGKLPISGINLAVFGKVDVGTADVTEIATNAMLNVHGSLNVAPSYDVPDGTEVVRVLGSNAHPLTPFDGGVIAIGPYGGPTGYIKTCATSGLAGSLVFGTRRISTDAFMTAGMTLDRDGNVGIGNPAAILTRLHVYNAGNVGVSIDSPAVNAGNLEFMAAGVSKMALYRLSGSSDLRVYTYGGAGDIMTFTYSTGRVGILNTNPQYPLDVAGQVYVLANALNQSAIRGENNNAGGSSHGVYGATNSTSAGAAGVRGVSNTSTAIGVLGSSTGSISSVGVRGDSTTGYGVYGYSSTGYGVYGEALGAGGVGVRGLGAVYGVRAEGGTIGVFSNVNGAGATHAIKGTATLSAASTIGVHGEALGGAGVGVFGNGGDIGVEGTGGNYGMKGSVSGAGSGVYGVQNSAGSVGAGVVGYSGSTLAWGGFFEAIGITMAPLHVVQRNYGAGASTPTNVSDGDIWFNTGDNNVYCRINGATKKLT